MKEILFKKEVLAYMAKRLQQAMTICPFITRGFVEESEEPLNEDINVWIAMFRLSDWNITIRIFFRVLFLNFPDKNLELTLANKKYLDAGLCHEVGHCYTMDICKKDSAEVEVRSEAIGVLFEKELNRIYGDMSDD